VNLAEAIVSQLAAPSRTSGWEDVLLILAVLAALAVWVAFECLTGQAIRRLLRYMSRRIGEEYWKANRKDEQDR
jgi:hypothetical protein